MLNRGDRVWLCHGLLEPIVILYFHGRVKGSCLVLVFSAFVLRNTIIKKEKLQMPTWLGGFIYPLTNFFSNHLKF
jgi:hypothetical protein